MASLFVEQLTVIDFSYLCPERGLVGESWLVDVVLDGSLNEQGMVFDFGNVKKDIKQAIDSTIDHTLVVPSHCDAIQLVDHDKTREVTLSTSQDGIIHCLAPKAAIVPIPVDSITPLTLKAVVENHLKSVVPDNVDSVSVNLYPQAIQESYYHYSHGLKKHHGDCQRIAHGHRSPLKIKLDGKPAPQLAQQWAKQWRDIYLVTETDILEQFEQNGFTYIKCGYQAPQGYFELTINKKRCYFFQTDTTVELIAQHLAQEIKKDIPNQDVTVQAYEGYKKGAIATV
ncbi:6-carboxytetrahydropterin synthase [Zooshikella harenae]|uniref:6-carboxy-5,6,7,8-tetrahydropterin synthase n=1 Tax=Zooshikella harenae TaxID=2827238 RepID=A0ABS5ZCG8_9GAMM|nr:6-carboxytetrahydropterin synthase [Zooshikella harenae]MBU2711754.1 6-carboxytetrahydropterin synthase [Zooshikella harenae]